MHRMYNKSFDLGTIRLLPDNLPLPRWQMRLILYVCFVSLFDLFRVLLPTSITSTGRHNPDIICDHLADQVQYLSLITSYTNQRGT
jgi:hypothetical protein